MSINVLALPNVRIEQSLKDARPPDKYTYSLMGHTEFQEILTHVVAQNPQWDFEFVAGRRTTIEDADNPGKNFFRLTKVKVWLGKEHLGDVGIEYHGSAEKVYVLNHRVAANRVRNQGKAFTTDPKRAISLINKNFCRRTPAELMQGAIAMAHTKLGSLSSARYYQTKEAVGEVSKWATKLVLENFDLLQPLLSQSSVGASLHEAMVKFEHMTNREQEAYMLREKADKGQATTVVVLHDSYVVHSIDTLSTFTHETLPEVLRGPLGMLKLVEEGTILPAGVRIDDAVFLINVALPSEGEKDAAQV